MLKHMVNMSHGIELKLCVEGIETAEELSKICEIEPDFIQGYSRGSFLRREDLSLRKGAIKQCNNKMAHISEEYMRDIHKIKKETIEELRMHFVFNALNAIRFLIKKDQNQAYDMVYDLAQFLRGAIDAAVSEGEVPLSEELDFVSAYINLEQAQRGKLSVEWDIRERENYSVSGGAVYRAVEKLLKEDLYINRQPRTLFVKKTPGEAVLSVLVIETGEMMEIPLFGRDIQESNENDIG